MTRSPFFSLWLCLLFSVSALMGGCSKSPGPVEAANAFFASIRHGQLQKAYESAAFGFQAGQSFQSFEGTVMEVGLANGTSAVDWKKTQLAANEARLEGALATSDTSIALSVTLIRERGEWRLFSLHTPVGQPGENPLAENRFTLVGKGASFSNAANREPPPVQISRQLVEDSLVMFNDAVQRHSFADFYNSISYSWQRQITLHQLQRAFQPFIDSETNLGPIRTLTAVFDEPPHINSDGVLVLNGHYPPQPYVVCFSLRFTYELPNWKLLGIDVRLVK